jgi:DNA-binding NarL/FixJ family response regulator
VPAVALQLEDPELLHYIAMILAEEAGLVALDNDNPDVVITDHLPLPRVLPAIIIGDALDGLEMLKAGASGILPRSCTGADLLLAIHAASRGFAVVPREPAAEGSLGTREDLLTARELEVLQLLAEGASNKIIARRLGISSHTAKFHVASIATKLDATGRTDAVAQAVRLGLILL